MEASNREIQQFMDKQFVGKSQDGIAIIMIGGPGSGKSTIIDRITSMFGFNKNSFVLIDSDPILKILYENNEKCRIPRANQVNDTLRDIAIKGRYNYIFCASGQHTERTIQELIKPSRNNHYTIYLSVVLTTIDVAIPRIKKRSLQTNRYVDMTYINNIYSKLQHYIRDYIFF